MALSTTYWRMVHGRMGKGKRKGKFAFGKRTLKGKSKSDSKRAWKESKKQFSCLSLLW